MKAGDPRHPASKPRHYESKRGSTLTLGGRGGCPGHPGPVAAWLKGFCL